MKAETTNTRHTGKRDVKSSGYKLLKILIYFHAIIICFVFVYFIISVQNSENSIGHKIAKETYIDEAGVLDRAEWMWNLSEFIAIFAGWSYFISITFEWLDKLEEVR